MSASAASRPGVVRPSVWRDWAALSAPESGLNVLGGAGSIKLLQNSLKLLVDSVGEDQNVIPAIVVNSVSTFWPHPLHEFRQRRSIVILDMNDLNSRLSTGLRV